MWLRWVPGLQGQFSNDETEQIVICKSILFILCYSGIVRLTIMMLYGFTKRYINRCFDWGKIINSDIEIHGNLTKSWGRPTLFFSTFPHDVLSVPSSVRQSAINGSFYWFQAKNWRYYLVGKERIRYWGCISNTCSNTRPDYQQTVTSIRNTIFYLKYRTTYAIDSFLNSQNMFENNHTKPRPFFSDTMEFQKHVWASKTMNFDEWSIEQKRSRNDEFQLRDLKSTIKVI